MPEPNVGEPQMARTKYTQLCAICGINLGTTKDHIPPQSLYPRKSRPQNMCLNYVMACKECNNGAAAADEEFKLCIGLATGDFRADSEVLIDSLAATVSNNRRLAGQVFQAKTGVLAVLKKNSAPKPCVAVTFNFKNFESVVSRIVKALYYMEFGCALGKDTVIKVFPFHVMDAEFHQKMKDLMDLLEPKFLNDRTFVYRQSVSEDGSSIWGMQFFGSPQTTTFAYAPAHMRQRI